MTEAELDKKWENTVWDTDVYLDDIDEKEPMTNEEWFCHLSTKEKAKWLENKMTWAAQEQGTFTAKGWVKWLKQPHTVKE